MNKTVKVRIAVAVDPDGDWYAAGWSSRDSNYEDDAMSCCLENIGYNERRYFIEAELTIPGATPETVQANVISVS